MAEAIFGLHMTLSDWVPEMELDEGEAEHLSKATKELGKFYAMQFDPKKVAWFNFCAAIGKVYIPRAIAIKNRVGRETKPKQPVQVIDKKPAPASPAAHIDFPVFESGALE